MTRYSLAGESELENAQVREVALEESVAFSPVSKDWVVRYPYAVEGFDLAVDADRLVLLTGEDDESAAEEVQEVASVAVETVEHVVSAPMAESVLDAWFEKYGTEFNVSPTLLKQIAYCESTFREDAVSPSGLYVGLFQFHTPTWISNRTAMGLDTNPDLRANGEEAIRTAAFKIGRDGVGAWPVCGAKAV